MRGKLREITLRSEQISLHKSAELASAIWRAPWRCFVDGGLCPEEYSVNVDYLEVVPGAAKGHKSVIGGFDAYLAMQRSFERSTTIKANVLVYEDLKREEIARFAVARVFRCFEGAALDVEGLAQLMAMLGESPSTLEFPVFEETDAKRLSRVTGVSKYRLENALKVASENEVFTPDFINELISVVDNEE